MALMKSALERRLYYNHVDHVFSVTSNVRSDGACFTCSVKGITREAVSNVWTSGTHALSTNKERFAQSRFGREKITKRFKLQQIVRKNPKKYSS